MIKLLGKVPKNITVALSGGPDSMAALTFLKNSKRNVSAIYFNHGTTHADEAEDFVKNFCSIHKVPLTLGKIQSPRSSRESLEEYWRNQRYNFFNTYSSGRYETIIMGHHLNDAVEWWVFSSIHGEGKLIPYENTANNIIRPFLLTKKEDLLKWLSKNDVPYLIDPSNKSNVHMRNYIRNNIIPHIAHINPGLTKVIYKKYINLYG